MGFEAVHRATVTDVEDPLGQRRVQVEPARELGLPAAWAPLEIGRVVIEGVTAIELTGSTVRIDAGALTVSTGMARFAGVVQCETLIANTVVASSYTPGTGNAM